MPDPEFAVRGRESEHWVRTTTGDGHLNLVMTGVVVLTAVQGSGSDWKRQRMSFDVPLPLLSPQNGFRLIHWAPLVTLSSISNSEAAVDAGWAVDGFGIPNPTQVQRGAIWVDCSLAVRDVDGFIARLGYMVNLLGDEVPA